MIRAVKQIIRGIPTTDGAGVNLKRILGTPELNYLDPFLLLDEFKSENPDDYIRGFPPHPHRGFETVTYLLHGKFRHRDSKGNEGLLMPGSVQWMTAGRGIIHSEMPETKDGLLWGFQLWVNLPSDLKMAEPGYQDIPAERIPDVRHDDVKVRIIAGEFAGTTGPAKTQFPIVYLDVHMSSASTFTHSIPSEMNSFCYVYEGTVNSGPEDDLQRGKEGEMMVFGDGDTVRIVADDSEAKLLYLAANRLNEPVARAGPFVMNSEGELRKAFTDYRNGSFHE